MKQIDNLFVGTIPIADMVFARHVLSNYDMMIILVHCAEGNGLFSLLILTLNANLLTMMVREESAGYAFLLDFSGVFCCA